MSFLCCHSCSSLSDTVHLKDKEHGSPTHSGIDRSRLSRDLASGIATNKKPHAYGSFASPQHIVDPHVVSDEFGVIDGSSSDTVDLSPGWTAPPFVSTRDPQFHPYLRVGEDAQNISVQFTNSRPGQDTTQLGSDVLQRRRPFYDEGPSMAPHLTAYPESSQHTAPHVSSPYTSDASSFLNMSCDLSTLHIVDLHGTQTLRRGSWVGSGLVLCQII